MPSSFGDALLRLWPRGDSKIAGLRAGIIASAPTVFASHGINTPALVAHVMAQLSHECGAGREVVENLNYTAVRLMEVWPSRFPTLASAQPFAGDPRALANRVYNGRMGNAAGSDDGWNFRGRGAAQTTGRDGYRRLAAATGLDLVAHPDLLIAPTHFLECGVADFVACGCLPFAKADDIVGVTRRLNGGTVGLADRKTWLAKWRAALGDSDVVFTTPDTPKPTAAVRVNKPERTAAPKPATSRLKSLIASLLGFFARRG